MTSPEIVILKAWWDRRWLSDSIGLIFKIYVYFDHILPLLNIHPDSLALPTLPTVSSFSRNSYRFQDGSTKHTLYLICRRRTGDPTENHGPQELESTR